MMDSSSMFHVDVDAELTVEPTTRDWIKISFSLQGQNLTVWLKNEVAERVHHGIADALIPFEPGVFPGEGT